jgi:RHS repeat-associated protein
MNPYLTAVGRRAAKRNDYLPFGQEILPPQSGGRATVDGYGQSEAVNQKFTGKERDIETGLDFFGARYLSTAQGRFTRPDKPFADQHIMHPQTDVASSSLRDGLRQ